MVIGACNLYTVVEKHHYALDNVSLPQEHIADARRRQMKKKFAFLAPLAALTSAILAPTAEAVPTSANEEGNLLKSQDVNTRIGSEKLSLTTNGDSYEFILRRDESGHLYAAHGSHSSHSSHSSHYSHYSHRSSSY